MCYNRLDLIAIILYNVKKKKNDYTIFPEDNDRHAL